MGKVVGCLVLSFSQGEVGAWWWLGNETAGLRRWRHIRRSYVCAFWVRERGGLDCMVGLVGTDWGCELVFDDCGGGRRQWLYAMVMELETARLRCWHHIWQPYVHGFGLRAGGLNWVVGVKAAGKVVAAVHCGGGWEIRGQGWWVWA